MLHRPKSKLSLNFHPFKRHTWYNCSTKFTMYNILARDKLYLHFEDWSPYTKDLDNRGIPHGDRIIKVMATPENPKRIFGKDTLKIPRYPYRPFRDETFDFGERGMYIGTSLEQYMEGKDFTEMGKRITRALFRFAVQPEAGFVQRAMAAKKDDDWFIDHPFKDLDSLLCATIPGSEGRVHIDIFYPDSLEALRKFVDFDKSSQIISYEEYKDYIRRTKWRTEGRPSSNKERTL